MTKIQQGSLSGGAVKISYAPPMTSQRRSLFPVKDVGVNLAYFRLFNRNKHIKSNERIVMGLQLKPAFKVNIFYFKQSLVNKVYGFNLDITKIWIIDLQPSYFSVYAYPLIFYGMLYCMKYYLLTSISIFIFGDMHFLHVLDTDKLHTWLICNLLTVKYFYIYKC